MLLHVLTRFLTNKLYEDDSSPKDDDSASFEQVSWTNFPCYSNKFKKCRLSTFVPWWSMRNPFPVSTIVRSSGRRFRAWNLSSRQRFVEFLCNVSCCSIFNFVNSDLPVGYCQAKIGFEAERETQGWNAKKWISSGGFDTLNLKKRMLLMIILLWCCSWFWDILRGNLMVNRHRRVCFKKCEKIRKKFTQLQLEMKLFTKYLHLKL